MTFFILFTVLFATDYFLGRYNNNNEQTVTTEQKDDTQKVAKVSKSLDVCNPKPAALSHQASHVEFSNSTIEIKVNPIGGLIDGIILKKYKEKPSDAINNKPINILSDSCSTKPYYISVTYKDENNKELVNKDTIWNISESNKTFLSKQNNGLIIERNFSLDNISEDNNYLVTITDKITNTSKNDIQFAKSASIFRKDPKIYNYAVVHEGIVVNSEHKVNEIKYEKIKNGEILKNCQWFGFTDKYWLCSILNNKENTALVLNEYGKNYILSTEDDYLIKLGSGESREISYTIFAGPKDINLLTEYSKKLNLDKFDRAIDFGWFFLLTKPLTQLMGWMSSVIPNMGIVILLLTLIFRFLTYPLLKKSFVSIAKMKKIQPQISALQRMYSNDKMRLNRELVAIYQREHISPLSGCLPMLLQAPIFFCLYKVFFISISMRHAPLFLWTHDLSEPDTCYITNLFGLINWDPPSFLQIGVWPLIMGATMLLQQKISSAINGTASQEKTIEQKKQEQIMYIMPIIFTYISISFPVCIIVYWSISNIIGIIQQQYVTKQINKK